MERSDTERSDNGAKRQEKRYRPGEKRTLEDLARERDIDCDGKDADWIKDYDRIGGKLLEQQKKRESEMDNWLKNRAANRRKLELRPLIIRAQMRIDDELSKLRALLDEYNALDGEKIVCPASPHETQ